MSDPVEEVLNWLKKQHAVIPITSEQLIELDGATEFLTGKECDMALHYYHKVMAERDRLRGVLEEKP